MADDGIVSPSSPHFFADGSSLGCLVADVALAGQGHRVDLVNILYQNPATGDEEIVLQLPPSSVTSLCRINVKPEMLGASRKSQVTDLNPDVCAEDSVLEALI